MERKSTVKEGNTRSIRSLRLRQHGCDDSESEEDEDDVTRCTGSSGVQRGSS